MPKLKTKKAVKKRFRLSATGKVMHRQAGTSHLATRKSKKRRRQLRGKTVLDPTAAKPIRQVLGRWSY